jgi:hypothetical protein
VETTAKSLIKTDSFILDAGNTVYIWNGPKTSRVKKTKALEIAKKLSSENKGTVVSLSEPDADAGKFWEILKGTEADALAEAPPKEKSDEEDDDAGDSDWLYRVSEVDGELQVTPIEV